MNKTVLIVAAHADDEVLGCGGTIARHVSEGDTVHAVFLADGVSARQGSDDSELKRRLGAAEQARKILGISTSTFMGFPDNRLDSLPLIEIVQPLERLIQNIKPQVIYTHHYGDLNVDHRVSHQAVMTACRPLPEGSVKEIYSFEVVSSTEWNSPGLQPFLPNMFVDVSEFLKSKNRALEAYAVEMRPVPHARSMENSLQLSEHRGSSVGFRAAEAFMVMRFLK